MGDNDRELGEITVTLKILAQNIDAIQRKLEDMSIKGCVVGKENGEKIADLQKGYRKIMAIGAMILVGGQAGIEWVKAILLP